MHTIEALKKLCINLKANFEIKFNPNIKWVFMCFDDKQVDPTVVHTTNIDERELKGLLQQCGAKMGNKIISLD